MTKAEASQFIKQLEILFDSVRLVNVPEASEVFLGPDGEERRRCREETELQPFLDVYRIQEVGRNYAGLRELPGEGG